MQIAICQKRQNFGIPYCHPSKCRPFSVPAGADAPFAPSSRRHWPPWIHKAFKTSHNSTSQKVSKKSRSWPSKVSVSSRTENLTSQSRLGLVELWKGLSLISDWKPNVSVSYPKVSFTSLFLAYIVSEIWGGPKFTLGGAVSLRCPFANFIPEKCTFAVKFCYYVFLGTKAIGVL